MSRNEAAAEVTDGAIVPAAGPASAASGELTHAPAAVAGALRLRLTRNLGWAFGADVIARAVSFAVSIFCARVLPVAGFGLFALVQSVAQYAWLLADGVANNAYAAREVARSRGSNRLPGPELFRLRMIAGVALAGFYLLVIAALPIAPGQRAAFAVAAIFFPAYASFPDWLARGLDKFRALALAQLAMGLAFAAACVVILPRQATSAVAVAIWGGSFLVGSAVLLPALPREHLVRLRPGRAAGAARARLSGSALFWLGGLGAMGITHLPTIVVGAMSPARELAQFSVALRVITACVGLGGIASWPFYTALSATPPGAPTFRETCRLFLSVMALGGVALALILWLVAGEALPALFGRKYADAVPLMRGLACTLPLYFVVTAFESVALATGAERMRALLNGIAVCVLVSLAFVLVPTMGARGAVLAMGASLATATAGYLLSLRRHFGGGAAA